jgi:fructokinase
MKQQHLLPKIHQAFEKLVNGYVKTPPLSEYIVTPFLNDDPGTIGCLALAKEKINSLF